MDYSAWITWKGSPRGVRDEVGAEGLIVLRPVVSRTKNDSLTLLLKFGISLRSLLPHKKKETNWDMQTHQDVQLRFRLNKSLISRPIVRNLEGFRHRVASFVEMEYEEDCHRKHPSQLQTRNFGNGSTSSKMWMQCTHCCCREISTCYQ